MAPPARKWWTLATVCVAVFMLLLDITVVNTALPSIRDDLGVSFTELQWVVDAYTLTLAALVLTAGSLADRLGRRRVFAVGLDINTIKSIDSIDRRMGRRRRRRQRRLRRRRTEGIEGERGVSPRFRGNARRACGQRRTPGAPVGSSDVDRTHRG
jgi:hypothetical protein